MVLLILLVVALIIGTSYALWQLTFTQNGTNVITTGCFKLTLVNDTDAINMSDIAPISDNDGKLLTPYTFTIKNICSNYTDYYINLETLSSGDKILPDMYVKENLVTTEDENDVFTDTLISISTYVNIEEAQNAYMLYDGELGPNEKKQFSLRLWMDEDTPAIDEVPLGKER